MSDLAETEAAKDGTAQTAPGLINELLDVACRHPQAAMKGIIFDNSKEFEGERNSFYSFPEPLDARTSAMLAMDKMILGNYNRIIDRPWICVNSGTRGSGKTTFLKLSCNRFVSEVSDSLFSADSLPRHAIFITMCRSALDQKADKEDPPRTRLFHRILFAIRSNRGQKWAAFVAEARAGRHGVIDAETVVSRIRGKYRTGAHVLIAADELRALVSIDEFSTS